MLTWIWISPDPVPGIFPENVPVLCRRDVTSRCVDTSARLRRCRDDDRYNYYHYAFKLDNDRFVYQTNDAQRARKHNNPCCGSMLMLVLYLLVNLTAWNSLATVLYGHDGRHAMTLSSNSDITHLNTALFRWSLSVCSAFHVVTLTFWPLGYRWHRQPFHHVWMLCVLLVGELQLIDCFTWSHMTLTFTTQDSYSKTCTMQLWRLYGSHFTSYRAVRVWVLWSLMTLTLTTLTLTYKQYGELQVPLVICVMAL